MTMDYRNPYSVYPEYYCPPYQGAGYQYPQQQQHYHPQPPPPQQPQQQQHYLDPSAVPGQQKNYNSSATRPQSQHQYLSPQQQQRPQHYHPAFHQHNQQQQQQHPHYSSPYLPNFLVSSGTGLTPSLTPTTITMNEQSFLELQSAQQNRVYESVPQSGFVPPVIDAGHSTEVSQDSQEYSSEYSDAEWEPTIKRGRMSVMKDIHNVDLMVTTGTNNSAPQRKYTRRNKDERLPPEEEEKRRVRRERNKLAAAKCRQRRVDHTNVLVAETEKLEAEQSQLESEIQNLQYVKDQLEFVLQAHQPLCKVEKSNAHSDKLKTDIVFSRVKAEPAFSSLKSGKDQIEFFLQCRSPADKLKHETGPCAAGCDTCCSHDASSLVPENLSMSTSAGSALSSSKASSSSVSATMTSSSIMETSAFNSRPTSLPLIKRERASMLSSATGITIDTPSSGVSITPSSLFYPGLESMVDGSTGLTPLTGMSCSSQVQQNTNEGRSESESNLISL